jgi:uncharacterized membrane protein YjdF
MTKRSWLGACRQQVDKATELLLSLVCFIRASKLVMYAASGLVVAITVFVHVLSLALS